ncbi:N-lysine methyltransferase KMT5A-A-like [Poecilia formosa]|uniref:N-lysine methyltransferase KMT5A-A-like n=1 Tax=Poecilia formosa TaxID=48698 RepID=UPI0007B8B062|nr:PREDICTED: N-lysine methyltransferase KMT5A-A-like [Poecilia formosa]
MQRRRRIKPKEDAKYYIDTKTDKVGLDVKYINVFKGHGIFATTSFQKGDFLCEYQGELISKEECERRQKVYHDNLKVFLFEFYFNGKLWCVDAAKEDGSLGRLINDDNISPNAKMKYLTVQQKPHLCLFATQDINQGKEITYSYGDSDWPWRLKELEKEMSQSPDCTHSTSTTDNTEQIRAENGQDQMTTSVPNKTDPVLDSLPINSEVFYD